MNLKQSLLIGTLVSVLTLIIVILGVALYFANHVPQPKTPDITLPTQIKAVISVPVQLVAETHGTEVKWHSSSADLVLIPVGPKTVYVVPTKNGNYCVEAWTAINGHPTDAAICCVTVGNDPGPGPGPVVDDFSKNVKAAYVSDSSTTKATDVDGLISVYQAANSTLVNDPSVTNVGQFYNIVHATAQAKVSTRLDGVRKVIASELDRTLPTAVGTPMDATVRSNITTQFTRVINALTYAKQ